MRTPSLEFPGFGRGGVQFLTFAFCCILFLGSFVYLVGRPGGRERRRKELQEKKEVEPHLGRARWAGGLRHAGEGQQSHRQPPSHTHAWPQVFPQPHNCGQVKTAVISSKHTGLGVTKAHFQPCFYHLLTQGPLAKLCCLSEFQLPPLLMG